MNDAILVKLLKQARETEALLFTLHRDCGNYIEKNQLGSAWISAKELRIALESMDTRRSEFFVPPK